MPMTRSELDLALRRFDARLVEVASKGLDSDAMEPLLMDLVMGADLDDLPLVLVRLDALLVNKLEALPNETQ